jgi:hypothetical protein
MPREDEMTVPERRKYLRNMKLLYTKAERTEQSCLLTEMEQVTGVHKKPAQASAGSHTRTQEARKGQRVHLWVSRRAGHSGHVGKPGFSLCRTCGPDSAFDGSASGSVWGAPIEFRGGSAAPLDQRRL